MFWCSDCVLNVKISANFQKKFWGAPHVGCEVRGGVRCFKSLNFAFIDSKAKIKNGNRIGAS